MIKKTKEIVKIFLLISFLMLALIPIGARATLRGTVNNAYLMFSNGVTTVLESGIYRTGAVFQIDLLVNTHGQGVDTVSAYINYNPSFFSVTIDTSGSLFPTEAENSVSGGKIKITRGITAPGTVNTTNGKIVTLNITGLADTTPSSDNFTFDFAAGDANQSNVFLAGDPLLSGVYDMRLSLDGTPPANVSSFTATPGDSQISLSWTNPGTDFAGVKIMRKTGSFPTSPTDGTSIYDSNGTSYTDSGLTNGTTYYYTAFSRDVVLNYSSGAQVSASPRDNIVPASISNLTATALTARTVKLDWTAVGDDGNTGVAASYDLRYSASSITAGNFSSATQVSGAPTPGSSGSAQTMTVSGLSGNTTYYFAIKAIDESSNASAISNVVNAKTYKTADLNNNNIVNAQDFSILMSFWGSTTRPAADVNQDGFVNAQDFSIMMSQWG